MQTAFKSKTRNVSSVAITNGITTTQAITMKQSLEIAQQFIHSSISCIAFLRNIFAERCFALHSKETLTKHATYQDYIEHIQTKPEVGAMLGYALLARGRKPVVDQFLAKIESAFTAVGKGILRALHINIILDPKQPANIVEFYTFSFNYANLPGTKALYSTELKHSSGRTMSSSDVRQAIPGLFRSLSEQCRALPFLPDRRFFKVELEWNEDWDGIWQPEGYEVCEKSMKLGQATGWERRLFNMNNALDTGHHKIDLEISHLAPQGFDQDQAVEPEDIPKLLIYSGAEPCHLRQKSCTATHDLAITVPSQQTLPEALASQVSTQTREGHALGEGLRRLLRGPAPIKNAGETQLLQPLQSQPQSSRLPDTLIKLRLSDDLIQELVERNATTSFYQQTSKGNEVDISCECRIGEEQDDMVQCRFCMKWQHLQCYGYRDRDDLRLPDVHVCYTCLLDEKENPLLNDLKNIILLRNAVRQLLDNGYTTDAKLAASIHCGLVTAKSIREQLTREGYLVHKVIKKKRKLLIVDQERSRMAETYFDPTLKIAHHVNLAGVDTQFTMPPLTTPLSRQVSRTAKSIVPDVFSPYTATRHTDDTRDTEMLGLEQAPELQHTAVHSPSPAAAEADQQASRHRSSHLLGKRKAEAVAGSRTLAAAMKKTCTSQTIITFDATQTPSRSEFASRASSAETEL